MQDSSLCFPVGKKPECLGERTGGPGDESRKERKRVERHRATLKWGWYTDQCPLPVVKYGSHGV